MRVIRRPWSARRRSRSANVRPVLRGLAGSDERAHDDTAQLVEGGCDVDVRGDEGGVELAGHVTEICGTQDGGGLDVGDSEAAPGSAAPTNGQPGQPSSPDSARWGDNTSVTGPRGCGPPGEDSLRRSSCVRAQIFVCRLL